MGKEGKTKVGTWKFDLPVASLKHPEKYSGKRTLLELKSSWEKAFVYYLDNNPAILSWSSEEIIIPYYNIIKQRKARYFPDFYIKYKTPNGDKKAIIEVKPFKDTQKPVVKESQSQKTNLYNLNMFYINQMKWKSAKKYCKDNGYHFFIITEKNLNFTK